MKNSNKFSSFETFPDTFLSDIPLLTIKNDALNAPEAFQMLQAAASSPNHSSCHSYHESAGACHDTCAESESDLAINAPVHAPVEAAYQESPMTQEEESNYNGFLPPPPPVPLDAFPKKIVDLLQEAQDAFGVPVEIPTSYFLAFLSALTGRSRQITIKEDWSEAGNIWIAIVAESGVGKTPCMQAIFAPIFELEESERRIFEQKSEEFKDEMKIYNAALKKGTESLIKPQKPRWRQAITNDVTQEALTNMLRDNPKGIFLLLDELSSLFGKGARKIKPFLLTGHSGASWKVSRASNSDRNFLIPNTCIGITGGIQPDTLTNTFQGGAGGTDEASGLLPRFMFVRAVQNGPRYFSAKTFSSTSKQLLQTITDHLWKWDIKKEKTDPVQVGQDALALYQNWHDELENRTYSANIARAKKGQAGALRVCLLLHCLDAAIAGTDGLDLVTSDTMRRALLLTNWFLEHQKQCLHLLNPIEKAKQPDQIETAIMQTVVECTDAIKSNGGKITSAELLKKVQEQPGFSRLSAKKLATTASSLGLQKCKLNVGGNSDRAWEATEEQIKAFRATVQRVHTSTI